MSEINKNVEIAKVQPAKPELKVEKKEEVKPQPVSEEKIKDFSNPTAEALGRSQVNTPDAIAKDVAFGMKHPDAIAKADQYFDMAYAQLSEKNIPNAYGKASELTAIYAKELATK